MVVTNLWSPLVAAIIVFALGAIWYSSALFGKIWCSESHFDKKTMKKKHPPFVYLVAFIFLAVAAYAFSVYLGPAPDLLFAVKQALLVGVCFVSTSFGINYLFGGKSYKLLLIDAGYHIFQFVIYGVVFAIWY
jgi:hypothetical protein